MTAAAFSMMSATRPSQFGANSASTIAISLMSTSLAFGSWNNSTRNLPLLVAGGGFLHGQHLAFDPQNAPPLCNLYVSMLQRLGIEVDTFSTGGGTLAGMEFKQS
jgi:hypothetical protein